MPSSPTFFTQATNFTSAVSGGVDPRTGLFNAHIGLGHLIGNRNLGPSLPLTLAYSPLTTTDAGFGIGFSLGLTTYDSAPDNRLLALSTGEQYKVRDSDTQLVLEQHKLDTLRVAKSDDWYRIVHKSGDVEYLTGPRNAFDTKVPTALLTPAGHRLDLGWDFHAEQPRLKTVRDETDQLLSVDYDTSGSKATLRILPNAGDGVRPEGYEIVLMFMNDLLATVRHHGPGRDAAPLEWQLAYTAVRGDWGHWLTKVTMPGGMTEEATYCDDGNGHQFPAPAPLRPLPYVIRSVRTPGGGQKQIRASYEYDTRNFLGGPRNSGVTWHPDEEGLYDVLTDYTYGSTETRECGGQTTTITRRYNRYHLNTEETTRRNGRSHSVATEYHAVTGRAFDRQPAQFQLPKTHTVTWTGPAGPNNARSEVTRTDFDTFGNPRSRTDPDGTVTTWTYYSANGEGDDCPAEPNGFTRLLENVTRTPPNTGFDAPAHTTSYRYRRFAAVPGSGIGEVVLKSSERHLADGRLLTTKAFTYTTSGAELGRITRLTETTHPEGESGPSFAAIHDFAFSVDENTLLQTHTLTAHDGLALTRSQARSRFTGRLWSATDAHKTVTTMTYDGLGRLLTRTDNTGDTTYETTAKVTHETGGTAPFVVTSTDPAGNELRASLDGMGRPILYERKDTDGDGTWYTVRTLTYDEQGRLSSATTVDHARDAGESQLTRTFSYDDWGRPSTTAFTDGARHLTVTDPVERTSTVQLHDPAGPVTGRQVTTYDTRHRPVSVQRFDLRNTPAGTRSMEYDGLGRLRRTTDEQGNTTRHDYDLRDRPTTTTLPDDTTITRTYAPSSPAALTTAIELDHTPYGTQTFDGLDRRTGKTVGRRSWTHGYAADEDPFPSTVTAPDGQTTTYRYIPQLDNALAQVTTGSITRTYTPDPVTGRLVTAHEGEATITRDYFPSRRLRTDTIALVGRDDRHARWSYTVGGLVQSYTGVDGATETITRDAFGRTCRIEDPAVVATPTYDSAGRATGWTATDKQSQHTLTTALELDDFGREVKRTLTDSGGTTWTLTQTWQNNDLLAGRTLTRGDTTLRRETFSYTSRNQLSDYACTEGSPPTDERGNPVGRQSFTYDAYGNLTRRDSTFATGSDTTTHLYGNRNDPCQLTGIRHTHPSFPSTIDLRYDDAGRLITDDAGRTLTYDPLGRLQAAGTAARFGYDPLDRLLTQTTDGTTSTLYYRRGRLTAVLDAGRQTRLLTLGATCLAQHRTTADRSETLLLGTDANGTVLTSTTGDSAREYAYTAHGNRPTEETDSVLGYNRQRSDPATGWYHLGNGYRAYNPVLMRFNTPDSLSPFGAGGINPYAYCAGDPVNRTDPTGHLSWGAWVSIGVGVLGVGLAIVTGGASIAAAGSVAAAVSAASAAELAVGALGVVSDITGIAGGALEEASPKASSILGYVSMGTGLAAGAGGARLGAAAERGASRLAKEAPVSSDIVESQHSFTGAAEPGPNHTQPPTARGSAPDAEGPHAEPTDHPDAPSVREAGVQTDLVGPPEQTLFHYTGPGAHRQILESRSLRPSLEGGRPGNTHYGEGQYLSNLRPEESTLVDRSRAFVRNRHRGNWFTHHVEIDTTGLNVLHPGLNEVPPRPHVQMIPGTQPLDLAFRVMNLSDPTMVVRAPQP